MALPQSEPLEARRLLSATISLRGDTLTIVGDDRANSISVTQDGAKIVVKADGRTRTYAEDAVDALVIDSRGGNDTVLFTRTDAVDEVTIRGGSGNDDLQIEVAHTPQDASDALDFTANVDGQGGNDAIDIDVDTNDDEAAGTPDNGDADPDPADDGDTEDDDHGPGDVDVDLQVNGSSGNDTIEVDVQLNGGDNGEVAANVDAGSGNDEVDLDVDGLVEDDDGNGDGDGTDDTTDDDPDANDGPEKPIDVDVFAKVNAGSGDDDIDVQLGTKVLEAGDAVNTGDYTVELMGGAGKDLLEVGLRPNPDEPGEKPSVKIYGQDGDDTLSLEVLGNTAASKLRSAFLLNGGIGTDTRATNAPSGSVIAVSCEKRAQID
jgi:hypothetical protein